MSQPAPETYPDVMPGTDTVNMSDGTHPKAAEQEYTLDDGGATANPVKKGEHKREVLPHP